MKKKSLVIMQNLIILAQEGLMIGRKLLKLIKILFLAMVQWEIDI
jgi:hypothetical protein